MKIVVVDTSNNIYSMTSMFIPTGAYVENVASGVKHMKAKIMSIFVATIMFATAFAIVADDESVALVHDNVLDLESDSAIVYLSGGSNTAQFTVKADTIPANYSSSDISWHLNNLDDGSQLVSFDSAGTQFTASGVSTVTVYGKALGSIEIVAEIVGTEYHASGVIVVFQTPGTQATEFHFMIKVDENAGYTPTLPDDLTDEEIKNGTWITVNQVGTGIALSDFTAFTALQWYCQRHNWDFDATSSGWINTFLGLGTYEGTNGSWIYWAQYHYDFDGSLVFNNTTLDYITTVDSSYIALVFWESSSSTAMPIVPPIED